MRRTTLAAAVLSFALFLSLSSPADAQSSGVKMYWTETGSDDIKRANLDGSSAETLIGSGLSDPSRIAVYGDKMYWLQGGIKRANLDGTSVETLASNAHRIHHGGVYLGGIALDTANDKLYWTQAGTHSLHRANLDGSSPETLIGSGLNAPSDLALDVAGGKVYWLSFNSHTLKRANLDGSSVETLIGSGMGNPTNMALDVAGGKVYWLEFGTRLKRANLDGTSIETIRNAEGTRRGFALDVAGGKVYWTETATDDIKRSNLDGSSVETLITTGLSDPVGIALPLKTNIPHVTVTSTTDGSVLFDWDDIEDATDYQYRYKLSSETDWSTPVTTSESTALVTGLLAATGYDFQARSRESGTPNDWSATLSITTKPRPLAVTRWPDRVGDLFVVSEGTSSAQLQWQHQIHAIDFDIGLWQAGQMDDLSAQGVTATVAVPQVWEQINTSVGVWSGSVYPEFDDANPYIGTYDDDPNKVILLNNYRYTDDILYYWHTGLGIWRVLRCASPSGGGCDYGTPSSADTRALVTVSSTSTFTWFNLDDGPPEWAGVYRNEDEALESAINAGAAVIFLDALNYARFSKLNSSTPSATISDLPDGRQYLAVRGVTNDGRQGAWSYLVSLGTEQAPVQPGPGEAMVTDDLIYTDELVVSQHYIYDEDTLLIQWPSLVGARHYDIRLRGTDVQRIGAAGGTGQEIGLDISEVSDSGIEYELRGVVVAGTLSYDVIGANGEVLYIVPPGRTAYSRWSASRVALITEDGTVAPGSQALLLPQVPTDRSTGIIRELLRATQLDDDASDEEVGRWMLPLGLLGSIMVSGFVGFGAGKGRFDKSAVVAGGMVFVLCLGVLALRWLGLSPVEVAVIFIVVLVVAALIALYQYFR